MTKVPGQETDYLEMLVRKEIEDIRKIGPAAVEILRVLQTAPTPLEIKTLASKILESERVYVDVAVDALNLRKGPGAAEEVIKVLPVGARLAILEPGGEAKIGTVDQWLRVADADGVEGFVVAQYLVRREVALSVGEKIDNIMVTLDQFDQMDLVEIFPQDGQHFVALTQRGKHIADYMSRQTIVKG